MSKDVTLLGANYTGVPAVQLPQTGGGVATFWDMIPLQTGTGTAGQAGSSSKAYIPAKWIYDIGHTPTAGELMLIKIPVAGISSGVWLSVDNGTTYHPVATINKTRLTTQYGINAMLLLMYEPSATTTVYGTDETGAPKGSSAADLVSDRWTVVNGYDANTTYTNVALGQGYGTCSTAAATAAKVVTLASYALTVNGIVAVKFDNDVPANATMNINNRGAKAIYYQGSAITDGVIKAGDVATFIYNTHYYLLAIDRTASVKSLPSVSSSDNGKFLCVVDGAWAAVTVASANGVNF